MNKIIFSLFFLLISINTYTQTTYYFSDSSGDDNNIGTTQSNPFKTIAKLNSLSLSQGDKILFNKGDKFIGQIIISHSGAENAPIIYDSYGTGTKPIIAGSNGDNSAADPMSTIKIIGKEYLEFHNLQIENERFQTDGTASNDDKSFGIYIQSFKSLPSSGNFEDATLFKHFRFSNLNFQNIYSLGSKDTEFNDIRTTGIYFFEAFVNDVIIEDCYFTDIERTGVWLRKYVSDVIIRNNKFIDLGGSGTIISVSKRVLYENNLMRFTGSDSDPRMTGRGSGMWVFGSDDVVAQYNISQHARGDGDSSGMHVDYSNTNILFQYNYLEDSGGGFCETLGRNLNVVWRYNISVNEGTDDKGGKNKLLWVNDFAYNPQKSEQVYIYNNTIYQGKDYTNTLGDSRIELEAKDINFLNNIIYLESSAKLGIKSYFFDVDTPNFAKNIMFGGTFKSNFKNLDATRLEVDPRFVAPGRNHFSGYKILSLSPAKGAAFTFTEPIFPLAGVGVFKDITSKATKDIFGNPVNLLSATNIGADNGAGETSSLSLNSYEAEDAFISGGSEVNCVNASSGSAVNISAIDTSLTFNNINVSETASYLIKVYYLNPTLSKLKMSINDAATETIVLPYSDGYCFQSGNPTSFHFIRTLNTGVNTIKFEQAIIDKIEVVAIQDVTLTVNTDILAPKINAYLKKSVISKNENIELIIANNQTNIKTTEVSVFDITGKLIFKNNFLSDNIKFNSQGFGSGLKIVTAKLEGNLIVKKLIVK